MSLVPLFSTIVFGEETCCTSVFVTGTPNDCVQSARMGTYTMLDIVSHGMPVYKQIDGSNYLYYWNTDVNDWLVGPDYTLNLAGVGSVNNQGSEAGCPDTFEDWRYYSGVEWAAHEDPITVTCTTEVTLAPPSYVCSYDNWVWKCGCDADFANYCAQPWLCQWAAAYLPHEDCDATDTKENTVSQYTEPTPPTTAPATTTA